MPRIVRAFPVLPGRQEELRAFARELATHPQDLVEFYDTYGITATAWYLQESEERTVIIVVTDVVAVEPFARSYAASERKFDRWFKDNVRRISGIDPNAEPLGPVAEALFKWSAP